MKISRLVCGRFTARTTMYQMFRYFTIYFILFVVPSVWAASDSLTQTANKATAEYRDNLRRLADWALQNGLQTETQQTLAMIPPEAEDRVFFSTFPMQIGTLDLPRGLPTVLPKEYAEFFQSKGRFANETEYDKTESAQEKSTEKPAVNRRELTKKEVWQIQFRIVRQNYARRLNTLARKAVKDERGTLAVQMAIAGLQADPDHLVFRNVFGFTKYKGEWRLPWETDKLRKGFVDHEKFGWMPQKAVARYEKGERYCNEKWVNMTEDTRFHQSSIENGWKIESEHYDIVTNHSLEEGVRLIRRLEKFYRAWGLLFFRYAASDSQLVTLFDGKPPTAQRKRYQINLYCDKQDFVRNLQPSMKLDVSMYAGFYRHGGGKNACHFFAVEPNAPDWQHQNVVRTMYHEATHQLFVESRSSVGAYGRHQNYWLVEGVADFMASFHQEGEYYVLGGEKARIAGRVRQRELLSTSELCQLNYSEFQDHVAQGQSHYPQSEAMFDFLFNYDGGKWRDPMIVYLRAVYDAKDSTTTLSKLTETTNLELDGLFKEYLQ